MNQLFSQLPGALLPWYYEKKRDLPWRGTRDPYRIWLSEIMLQQTRVEAVKGYYQRFLNEIPTIKALAEADDMLLHKLWEGLGYYSRVRNLKKAAQVICNEYGGTFPGKYEQVLSLPGIGEYTAGAVCSIAFDMPVPAVDGNVLRVAARLTNDTTPVDLPAFKKYVREQLMFCYPERAGDFTQALMELGATVCGPNRKPDCEICPCKEFCLGNIHKTAERLPVRLPKRGRRMEEKTVLILCCDDRYAVERRQDSGLLAGLWQFPNLDEKLTEMQVISLVENQGGKVKDLIRTTEKNHIFTHIHWNMVGIYLNVKEPFGDYCWVSREQIEKDIALPTAFRQFWTA